MTGTSTNGSMRAAPRSLGKPSASYPGAVATDAHLAIAVDRQQTTLAIALGAGDTSMTVASSSQIVTWSLLSIDNEIVQVNGPATGNAVPVTRGFDGTTAAIHVAGTAVSGLIDAYHHNTLVAEIEAIEGALGTNLSRIPASAFVVASAYIFPPQSPGGSLTPGTNSILLTPVPAGVNGTNTNHYLYISGGTGAAEAVPITGGGAVSGAPSGTIFVTCANAHSGAWTIQTATSGGEEAMYSSSGPVLVIYPAGSWNMYARLYYPRDGVAVSGMGYGATKLVWQLNLAGDLIYAGGTGGTSPVPRIGIELRNLAIYSTVVQTAGAAFHAFACRYPIVYNVDFQGGDVTATLYHGIWFDQLDYGYVDRVKVVCAGGDCIRVDGCVGGGIKAGLFISNALISSSPVGIHVGGAFGGVYVTMSDIVGNGTGVLVDNALAAETNREIFLDATTSIDSSTTTGIDLVNGLDNGYLGLSGTWLASNRTGMHIRSAAGTLVSINISGGTFFNHSIVGILNESDQGAGIMITGTVFRSNAIAINQSVNTGGAALNFVTNGVRYDSNTTDVSGQINVNIVTLVNGANNDIPRYDARLVNVTGPTAAFSINGLAGGRMGDVVYIRNTTAQVMTIAENSATSAAANRILTFQGSLAVKGAAILVYGTGLWYVAGYN